MIEKICVENWNFTVLFVIKKTAFKLFIISCKLKKIFMIIIMKFITKNDEEKLC
jgi:hypothetical protein